jgi:hypothetical protein
MKRVAERVDRKPVPPVSLAQEIAVQLTAHTIVRGTHAARRSIDMMRVTIAIV